MSKSSANAEPSMEEILASIRQIISDDEPAEAEAAEPELESGADEAISEADLDALFSDGPSEPEPEDEPSGDIDDGFASVAAEPEGEAEDDDEDVLDLGAMSEMDMDLADEPFDPPEDLDFAEPEPEPEFEPEPTPMPEPEPARAPVMDYKPVDAAASAPLSAETPLIGGQTDSAVSAAFADLANTMLSGNARTLEDLVQDMLRPMLKSWLDENLPTMVEKMVREEIERVARRGPRP
ncbi:MAG: PopZ family protein [Devosiaceae bacterium]